MAIAQVAGPTVFLYPGQIDQRYPIGRWVVSDSVAGDASGGDVQHSCRFRASTDAPLFLAFSLEYLQVSKAGGTVENAYLLVNQFSQGGVEGAPGNIEMGLETLSGGGGQFNLPWAVLPLFMGAPIRGQNSDLRVTWATNDNLINYGLRAGGQIWLYAGLLDFGGPQPVTSSIPSQAGQSQPTGSLQQIRSARIVTPANVQPVPLPGEPVPIPLVQSQRVVKPGIHRPPVNSSPGPATTNAAGPAGQQGRRIAAGGVVAQRRAANVAAGRPTSAEIVARTLRGASPAERSRRLGSINTLNRGNSLRSKEAGAGFAGTGVSGYRE